MKRALLFTALFLGCFSGPENHASGTDQLKHAQSVTDGESNTTPPRQASSSPKGSPQTGLERSSITIHPVTGDPITLEVELAVSPREREKGMMFRTEIAPLAGMIFIMDRTANHRFWMKNTLIPLDMLFIAEDGEVVGVVENATPKSLKGRGVGTASRYILEIGGGESKRLQIGAGSWVNLAPISDHKVP